MSPPSKEARPRSGGAQPCAADRIRLFAVPMLLAGLAFAAVLDAAMTPAAAQGFTFNPIHTRPKPPPPANNGQMLVQAVEVDYDYNNQRVSAVGNVQMHFNGTSIEADKVIYDQKTKRLHAEGNIRLTDADGKITYANIMDLSDDYRDGFVDSLRVDSPEQTRMAATRADRSSGNYTVFENGVYTACAPCKDDPKKPPLWQVKGARIIHDQSDKMMYFENAQLEFFGVPMAYLPYFSTPDPTVKRKTGFLMPYITSTTTFGFGVETPFYWAIAPGLRCDLQSANHDPAGRVVSGRIPPAPDQRLVSNPRLRNRSAGSAAPSRDNRAIASSAAASTPRASSR